MGSFLWRMTWSGHSAQNGSQMISGAAFIGTAPLQLHHGRPTDYRRGSRLGLPDYPDRSEPWQVAAGASQQFSFCIVDPICNADIPVGLGPFLARFHLSRSIRDEETPVGKPALHQNENCCHAEAALTHELAEPILAWGFPTGGENFFAKKC